mmetsp:Transcript_18463/g.73757  ORF Transcript_18463/g.73757 Transcript_18463/m.73757 type:complete len:210 (-) Transcript_18463:1151-1780(-)
MESREASERGASEAPPAAAEGGDSPGGGGRRRWTRIYEVGALLSPRRLVGDGVDDLVDLARLLGDDEHRAVGARAEAAVDAAVDVGLVDGHDRPERVVDDAVELDLGAEHGRDLDVAGARVARRVRGARVFEVGIVELARIGKVGEEILGAVLVDVRRVRLVGVARGGRVVLEDRVLPDDGDRVELHLVEAAVAVRDQREADLARRAVV